MQLRNFSWQWSDHWKARQPPTCHMSSHWQQYVSYACQKACQGHRKHFGFHSYANSIASPVSDGHLPMEFKRTWLALLRWPGSPDDRWSLLSAPVVKPLPNLAFLQRYCLDRSRTFLSASDITIGMPFRSDLCSIPMMGNHFWECVK